MHKKKKYYKSEKECENIHSFIENWYGVKTPHRKKTRFHHNDIPIFLMNRGILPPETVNYDIAFKDNSDQYIFVIDDDKNIRCYKNKMSINMAAIIKDAESLDEEEQLKKRRKALRSCGYDYDPCTGEVDTIENLEYLNWLYSLEPTERRNRQGHQKVKK